MPQAWMASESPTQLHRCYVCIPYPLHGLANFPSTMLEQALSIFNNDTLYRNEIARTSYKLGCVLQDSGDISKGKGLIEKAEALRREILPGAVDQDVDEDTFNGLVMFWSR